jgi:hypothetical protein
MPATLCPRAVAFKNVLETTLFNELSTDPCNTRGAQNIFSS